MLNDLVNNTGIIGCGSVEQQLSKQCIEEIYCCINDVQCMTCKNTQDIKDIKDTQDISVKSVSSTSMTATSITASGIKSDNVGTKCINVSDKATVGSLESGDIKAEDIEANSIHTGSIDGLNSLTVEGEVWADKVHTDNLDVVGCITSNSVDTNRVCTEVIVSDINKTHALEADCAYVGCFITPEANINKACIGNLSTSNLSSDSIDVSRITSTSLSVPKVETSGGITGKGTIDTTSAVWKEIKLPLFTGTVQFYTDEWKVTITGGREFIWEDPSLEHLKFISNDGETVTVAVDWDGEVYYTYNVAKEEPVITLVDNTGHTENNDHTFIMQNSGLQRGTVFIYQDKEYANQGIDILGKLKASNLEITCSQSMDCASIEHLHIGSSLISENPINVDICARCFCIASPCSYISNNLYTNNIESDNICNKENIHTKDLCADNVNVKCEINTTKVCSCDSVTEKLYVNECSEFHGPTYFYDNIYQCGETWCTHAQNVYTCSDTITMREGATFAGPAQIKVLKYDGTNNGVIYLGKDGTLRVGDETNCQPVLTRSEEKDLSDGHGLIWDAENKCVKDSGETLVTCAYVNCVGKACKESACCNAITMDKLCLACSYACARSVCCNTITRDTLCLACSYACTNTKASCACTYAGSIGTSCKNAACSFAVTCGHAIGKACKESACCSAITMDTLCLACSYACTNTKALCACAYANTMSVCNINVCRGLSVIGTSTYCDSKCWGTDGNWAYLTFTDAPNNHWHYVIKMDGYDACRRAGLAFPADDFQQYGVYYKLGYIGGNDGWKLIPDITCVQKVSLSCSKASETSACTYADLRSKAACAWSLSCATTLVSNEEKNRKNNDALCLACSKAYTDTKALNACSFAVTCVQKTTPDTSTFAKNYGGSTNCVQYAYMARNVNLGNYTYADRRYVYIGNPENNDLNIGCNANLWFCPTCNVLAMGGNGGATICLVSTGSDSMAGDNTKYNPKVVFDTMDNQRGCLQYSQYDTVHAGAGLCWMTNQGSTWFDTDNIYANTLTIRNNSLRLGSYNIYIG